MGTSTVLEWGVGRKTDLIGQAYAKRRKKHSHGSQQQPQESQTVALSVHVALGTATKLPHA